MQDLECTDCHMPKMVKGAVERGPYEADIPTHLLWIVTDPGAEQFYEEDGKLFSYPYITAPYVCLPCHPGQSEAWAYENARDIH
jgi:hypothetical protein